MSTAFKLPQALRELIRARAESRCEYCQTSEWREHFAWSEEGTTIIGLTAEGRATVLALKLNHPLIVAARSIWVSAGLRPPE